MTSAALSPSCVGISGGGGQTLRNLFFLLTLSHAAHTHTHKDTHLFPWHRLTWNAGTLSSKLPVIQSNSSRNFSFPHCVSTLDVGVSTVCGINFDSSLKKVSPRTKNRKKILSEMNNNHVFTCHFSWSPWVKTGVICARLLHLGLHCWLQIH